MLLMQVLCNIQVFAKVMPSLFAPHFEDFFISSSDTYQIKALKLEILSSIATDSSISAIFQEFQFSDVCNDICWIEFSVASTLVTDLVQRIDITPKDGKWQDDYVRDPDRTFAADTVAAIGLCARQLPNLASTCLEGLLALTTPKSLNRESGYGEGEAIVLIQAMISINAIIKLDPPSHEKVIIHLVRRLESIKVPAARSLVIWMVGEYNSIGHIIPKMLPTTLKYLAWCFSSEALETKLQILNATVKVLLCAKGEDLSTFKSILSYVLELARSDLNYDIRDRARVFMKLLSCYICSHGAEGEEKHQPNEKDLPRLLAECIFRGQAKAMSPVPVSYRFYLPGSLSLIVLHAAPGYDPLPEPCSLTYNDNGPSLNTAEGDSSRDSYKVEDLDTISRSMDEESTCSDGSQDSATGSSSSGMSGSASGGEDNTGSFINFSDVAKSNKNQNGGSDENDARFGVNNLGELMSKSALESWLDEKPDSSHSSPEESDVRRSLARISIGDITGRVKPKTYTLLDPANGNGLKVDYTFLSEISSVSPLLICVEVTFTNCSTEAISELNLSNVDDKSQDSSDGALTTESPLTSHSDVPTLVPMEEVTNLKSGQSTKRILHVRFDHHLLPLKLVLWCNGKKHPLKLRPDIGYFVRPLPMDIAQFSYKESQLRGMFEYTRRCTFIDYIRELDNEKGESSLTKDKFLIICESLGLKMLSNANLFLVSVDMPVAANLDDASGLCMRFSCEILSNSVPCLITITLQGKCSEPLDVSVKVNCEETVFGLNFLNRVVNFLP
ncbi:hypothetical protein RJ639_024452 [Escallonia herrerae]|uniref:AP-3 complex subunit beta C-terminal domain-containing protein n=1 Tax=Escallonia herrerae TaxID=1293975 RepID=A0AA89AF47_9ASTE|nr:hypothetical protein RJ639_024452 [Escallonia herrerae]